MAALVRGTEDTTGARPSSQVTDTLTENVQQCQKRSDGNICRLLWEYTTEEQSLIRSEAH